MNKVFKVKIKAKTDFHTSKTAKGSVVEALVFSMDDGKYKAVIPGSTIKGLMRWEFERLWFGAHNVESCKLTKKDADNNPDNIHERCKRTKEKLNGNCPICDIFGMPNTKGGVEYKHTNLKVLDFETEIEETCIRTRNAINRDTGETNPFSMQVVPAGKEFVGRIIVTNMSSKWASYIKNTLMSALNFGIGGSRSSGFGAFELLSFEEDTDFCRIPDIIREKGRGDAISEIKGWKLITGKITNETPAYFGTGKELGTFHPTFKHIPGQQLRGMFGFYIKKIVGNDKLYDALSMAPSEEKHEGDVGIIFKNALPQGQVIMSFDVYTCKKCGRELRKKEECPKCHMEGSKKGEGLQVKKYISTKNPYPRDYSFDKNNKLEKLDPYHIELIEAGQEFDFKCLVRIDDILMNEFVKCLSEAGIYAGSGGFKGRGYGVIRFSELKVEEASDYVYRRADELKENAKRNALKLVVNSPMVFPAYDAENNKSDHERNNIALDANMLDYAFSYDKRHLSLKPGELKYKLPLNLQETKSLALKEAKFGHWSLRNKDQIDRVEHAIAPGSAAIVVMAGEYFEKAAIFELFGLGRYRSMGYGDFTFVGVEE